VLAYHGAIVGPELLLLLALLIVVLVWRGPSTLPRLGEAAGKAVRSARQGLQDRSKDAEDEAGGGNAPGGSDEPGTRAQP